MSTLDLSRRQVLALGAGGAAALALGLPSLASASIAPKSQAPDFTLKSIDGPNLRLQEQRGKVVLLNFWATWCGPCREEMPQLNKLYEKYRPSGFTLLGVNVDEDGRNAAGVASQLGVKFPVLLDTDKRVIKLYDISTMPSTVMIDRDGRVRFLNRGYKSGTELEYDQQIRALLKE
ncbi:TlpA family protein disulfide reductase [Ideonella sp.]|uniref:TlpA family protein disulfide reductase n=1 Tax=Ideonella sp. TaxID=1929293 RepID=UPI0035B4CBB0